MVILAHGRVRQPGNRTTFNQVELLGNLIQLLDGSLDGSESSLDGRSEPSWSTSSCIYLFSLTGSDRMFPNHGCRQLSIGYISRMFKPSAFAGFGLTTSCQQVSWDHRSSGCNSCC